MARTLVTGNILRSGSIPTAALPAGTITSSVQLVNTLPVGTVSSSTQVSYTQLQNIPTDIVSSSTQVTAFLPNGTVSSSTQLPSGIASSSAQVKAYLPTDTVSSSAQVTAFLPTGTVSSSTQLPSGIVSSSAQVTAYLPAGTVSSSVQVDFNTISNKPTLVSGSAQIDVRNTTGITTIATTGSNTFTGVTAISDTTNSTNYLNGAVTVAGGMSIQKDLRISGSMTINGLLTVTSMSSQYVTSSQYNVGVSKITLNDDDNVRFAGMSIYDSGSSNASASIYWDSMQHRFIYENLSGSAYNSAIIIAGPKNTGSLGNEGTLTSGYLPYATGTDHIDNSVMYQSGSSIGIGTSSPTTTLHVNGGYSGSAANYSGNVTAATLTGTLQTAAQTNVTSVGTLSSLTVSGDLTVDTSTLKVDSTNDRVGIGIATPGSKLHVAGAFTKSTGDENTWGIRVADTTTMAAGVGGGLTFTGLYTAGGAAAAFGAIAGVKANSTTSNGLGELRFYTTDVSSVLQQRVTIDGSGNVGIGTSAFPSTDYKFVVKQGTDRNFAIAQQSSQLSLEAYNDAANASVPLRIYANPLALLNGNVGIGTTNPTSTLTIASGSQTTLDIQATSTGGTARLKLNPVNNTFYAIETNGSTDALQFMRGSGELLRINSSGNLGIGITNPSSRLHVYDSSNSNLAVARIENYYLGDLFALTVKNNGSDASQRLAGIEFTGNNDVKFAGIGGRHSGVLSFFYSSGGTLTEGMRINSSGNVGIGTTGPNVRLHLGSTAYTNPNGTYQHILAGGWGVLWRENYDSYILGNTFYNSSGQWISTYGGYGGNVLSLQDGEYHFHAADTVAAGSAYTLRRTVTFTKAGNVGIGTTNPNSTVHIRSGGSDRRVLLQLDRPNTSGLQTALQFTVDNILVGQIQHEYPADNYNHMSFTLRNPGGSNFEILRLDNGGNVGIGITGPSTTLVVASDKNDPDVGQIRVSGVTNPSKILNLGYNTTSNYGMIQALIAGTGYSNLAIQPNGGNVGIGTISPLNTLHVEGQLQVRKQYSISSTESTIATGTGCLLLLRDNTNGGTALVLYENANTPIIISQSGTNYTTSTPTGTQIQLKNKSANLGVSAVMASGQSTTLNVCTIVVDHD